MKPRASNKAFKSEPAETLQAVKKKLKRRPSSNAASSGSPKVSAAAVASTPIPVLTQRAAELAVAPGRLQGEQIKRASAEEASSEAGESFRTIADSMPELISYIDAEQRYQFNNRSYEKWFGFPSEDFKGHRVQEMLGDAVYAIVRPYLERALAGECTSYEGYISHKKFGRRYLHADYVPRKDERGKVQGIYVVTRDLTQLKEAEQKYRTFLETAPDAMVIQDPQGKIAMINVQTERMFGYSRQELIGQPTEMLIPERFREAHSRDKAAYLKNPVPRTMGWPQELYGMRKDGSEFLVEISLSPIETADGTLVSSAIRDATEREQLAQQIRWSATLEERSRMARDIHDTLAQGFTAVILNLEAVEEACADLPEEVRRRITRAREVARGSLEEARRSVLTLSNCVDLAACLQGMAERYRSMSAKTRVEFSVQGTAFRLDPAIEENLCHIAQQATDNALQHARARTIRIEIAFDQKRVQLQIRDDGQGFDVKKARRGLGVTGMRARANAIGGNFKLNSQPGKGTCVEVKIPLAGTTRAATSP